MTRDDALKLLQISEPNPTPEQIVAAYRRMARKYHPDVYATADDTVKEVMSEKFIRCGEAKSLLLDQAGQNPGASTANPHFEGQLIELERMIERRQFQEALTLIDAMQNQFGESALLYEARYRVYDELERPEDAYTAICSVESLNPDCRSDADFQHAKAITAAEAERFGEAHRIIERAISLLPTPAPAFIATKAHIYILQGQAEKADGIIDDLKRLDPNHPLVEARGKVFRVGEAYVDKKDAATTACAGAAILELLFDCI